MFLEILLRFETCQKKLLKMHFVLIKEKSFLVLLEFKLRLPCIVHLNLETLELDTKDYRDHVLFQDGRLTAGGGATEIELAQQIAAWGETHPGLEQYSIGK